MEKINSSSLLKGLDQKGVKKRRPLSFDPLEDLLVAQQDRPAHWIDINFRTLSPFQRALLVIDGTVTKFLEAYTMEPIDVVQLEHSYRKFEEAHIWLNSPKETTSIARQVTLEGKYSRKLHAYAVSLLVVDRLPEGVKEDLKTHPGGIGRVLLKHQLETRREVLWYGREQIETIPDSIMEKTGGKFISRTYRILHNEDPFMMINEKFPLEIEQGISHH